MGRPGMANRSQSKPINVVLDRYEWEDVTKLGQPEVVLGPKVMWIILTSYVKRGMVGRETLMGRVLLIDEIINHRSWCHVVNLSLPEGGLICVWRKGMGVLGEQEQQEIVPHAIVCVDEAVANPLSVLGNDIDVEE